MLSREATKNLTPDKHASGQSPSERIRLLQNGKAKIGVGKTDGGGFLRKKAGRCHAGQGIDLKAIGDPLRQNKIHTAIAIDPQKRGGSEGGLGKERILRLGKGRGTQLKRLTGKIFIFVIVKALFGKNLNGRKHPSV